MRGGALSSQWLIGQIEQVRFLTFASLFKDKHNTRMNLFLLKLNLHSSMGDFQTMHV